ncbi:MAG: hypothetical protein WCI43_09180, partial [Candidatus Firestonebacteria bacterium]
MKKILFFLVSFFAAIFAQAGGLGRAPLYIEEAAGVSRLKAPVTTGVPFKQGVLLSSDSLRIK